MDWLGVMIASLRVLRSALVAIGLLALGSPSSPTFASILGNTAFEIDFTQPDEAATKATWSESIAASSKGLGWEGSATTVREGWIQTAPVPTGLWWRPPIGVHVRVEILPGPASIVLGNGKISTPFSGEVFVRYSADRVHWSSWQKLAPLRADEPSTPVTVFTGHLGVPARERTAYVERLRAYAMLDVPWASDEEAAARWIVDREPDFFARQIPFIGYVEILHERSFHGGQPITHLKAGIAYGMSGMSAMPKDPELARRTDHSAWRFIGPDPGRSRSRR
jgi:hypothetical protein